MLTQTLRSEEYTRKIACLYGIPKCDMNSLMAIIAIISRIDPHEKVLLNKINKQQSA